MKLLDSFIAQVEQEIQHKKKIIPDAPMEQQFDDVFNKHHLIAGAIKFEMKHRVEIPDEYMDFGDTVQTLVRKAAKLKKIENARLPKFLREKQKLLDGLRYDTGCWERDAGSIRKGKTCIKKSLQAVFNRIRLQEETELQATMQAILHADLINDFLARQDMRGDDRELSDYMKQSGHALSKNFGGDIYRVCRSVLDRLGCPEFPVEFYVQNDSTINASGYYNFNDREPHYIVLHSGLLDKLTDEELPFVIGHELGHLLYGHAVLDRLARTLYPDDAGMPLFLDNLNGLRKKLSELSADRIGLLAVNDLETAIRAVVKLSTGLDQHRMSLTLDTYMATIDSQVADMRKNPLYIHTTHPVDAVRSKALSIFYHSRTREHFIKCKGYRKDCALAGQTEELVELLKRKPCGIKRWTEFDFLATAGLMIMNRKGPWRLEDYACLLNILSQYHCTSHDHLKTFIQDDIVLDKYTEACKIIAEGHPDRGQELFAKLLPLATREQKIRKDEVDRLLLVAENLKIPKEVAEDILFEAIKKSFRPMS